MIVFRPKRRFSRIIIVSFWDAARTKPTPEGLALCGWVARTASLTKARPCPLDRLPQRPQTDVLPAQTESGRPLFQRVLVFIPSLSW